MCAFNYLFVFKIQGLRVGEPAPQTLRLLWSAQVARRDLLLRSRTRNFQHTYNGIASVLSALSFHRFTRGAASQQSNQWDHLANYAHKLIARVHTFALSGLGLMQLRCTDRPAARFVRGWFSAKSRRLGTAQPLVPFLPSRDKNYAMRVQDCFDRCVSPSVSAFALFVFEVLLERTTVLRWRRRQQANKIAFVFIRLPSDCIMLTHDAILIGWKHAHLLVVVEHIPWLWSFLPNGEIQVKLIATHSKDLIWIETQAIWK
jgi:hypothetical protein